MKNTSTFELLVSSNKLKPDEIPEFELGVKITNNGPDDIPFDISGSELYVNSMRSFSWDLTTQNGTLRNMMIHANKSKTIKWPLGEALFGAPGIYELKFIWNSAAQKQVVYVLEV